MQYDDEDIPELPEFNEEYPNYGAFARAWAERIPTEGADLAAVLGPGLRALTYALLDAGDSTVWAGRGVSGAILTAADKD